MNEMQVFQYENNEVRTVEQNGEVWWVLADVCRVLGVKNPTDVRKRLDEDERARFNLGRQGEANIISESGLYKVILRSDKPEAKKFTRWVTHEVLPTIRRTGGYGQVDVTAIIMQTATAVCVEMVKQLTPLFERVIRAAAVPGYEVSSAQVTTTEAWRASYHPGPRKKVVSRPPAASGQLRIETFPAEVRQAVDEMMEQMMEEQALNFSEIARYCNRVGCMISSPSVRRYYDKYFNR